MFTVGKLPTYTIYVHQHVFMESSVFKAMCSPRWRDEKATRIELELPDDDPDDMGRLFEHLYGKEETAFRLFGPWRGSLEKLFRLYTLGDKYALPSFQSSVRRRLFSVDSHAVDPSTFFEVVADYYPEVPKSDKAFANEFDAAAKRLLRHMSAAAFAKMTKVVEAGGEFAVKLFILMVEVRLEMDGSLAAETQTLNNARTQYTIEHPTCRRCIVSIPRDGPLA